MRNDPGAHRADPVVNGGTTAVAASIERVRPCARPTDRRWSWRRGRPPRTMPSRPTSSIASGRRPGPGPARRRSALPPRCPDPPRTNEYPSRRRPSAGRCRPRWESPGRRPARSARASVDGSARRGPSAEPSPRSVQRVAVAVPELGRHAGVDVGATLDQRPREGEVLTRPAACHRRRHPRRGARQQHRRVRPAQRAAARKGVRSRSSRPVRSGVSETTVRADTDALASISTCIASTRPSAAAHISGFAPPPASRRRRHHRR